MGIINNPKCNNCEQLLLDTLNPIIYEGNTICNSCYQKIIYDGLEEESIDLEDLQPDKDEEFFMENDII